MDAKPLGGPLDCYSANVVRSGRIHLGAPELTTGSHELTSEVVGKNDKSVAYCVGPDLIELSMSGIRAKPRLVKLSEIIRDLKHKDSDVRAAAAWSLAALGKRAAAAVPSLIDALADEDAEVRRAVVYALGEVGSAASPAVAQLRNLLEEPNEFVRTHLVPQALEKITASPD